MFTNVNSRKQSGFVLIATLGILVILTIIGIAALTTSNVEIQLATMKKIHGKAFYLADSGAYVAPKIISQTVWNKTATDLNNAIYMDADDGESFKKLLFDETYNDSDNEIKLTHGKYPTLINVQRIRSENLPGYGGAEYMSDNKVSGRSGSQVIYYGVDSTGHGPHSETANVYVKYRQLIP